MGRAPQFIRSFFKDIADFVYPPYCAICHEELDERNRVVCENCFQSIHFIDSDFCVYCGRPLKRRYRCSRCTEERLSLARIRALGEYDETLSRILHLLKYGERPSLATRLGMMMASVVMRDPVLRTAEWIVPVPLHPVRRRERGYNQSDLIARALGESCGIRTRTDFLQRRKNTRSQTDLSPTERARNVAGAFCAKQTFFPKGATLLLVDDVITTGATLHSCGLALLTVGARKVYGITCAAV